MIRELVAIGKQLGSDLEVFVQKEKGGMLYLLDLYPEEKRARLVPHQLDKEKSNIATSAIYVKVVDDDLREALDG